MRAKYLVSLPGYADCSTGSWRESTIGLEKLFTRGVKGRRRTLRSYRRRLALRTEKVGNALSNFPDAFRLSTHYSRRNEPSNIYERSTSMLHNFFAIAAGREAVMLIAIYAVVITVVAELVHIFGL
jgi:hypothetical protein